MVYTQSVSPREASRNSIIDPKRIRSAATRNRKNVLPWGLESAKVCLQYALIAVKRKSVVRPRSQRPLEHLLMSVRVNDFEGGVPTRPLGMFKTHFAQRAEVIAGHRLLWAGWQVPSLISVEGRVPA